MVGRIINLLHKEFNNINQAAILLGLFAFLSQILGLIRDRTFAHVLGPSSSLDIYYAAFRIPDFLYVTVASLVAVTALLPFLTERLRSNDGEKRARDFFSTVFSAYFIVIVIISGLLILLIPYLAPLIAPGFGPDEMTQLVKISRIMLVSPILMGLSNLFASVTQMYRRFFVYAVSPVLYNAGILIGILVFFPIFGLAGLAYGVILGAFLHGVIQIPVLLRHKFFPRFHLRFSWKQLGALIGTSLPRTLGLATHNIALIAIVALASLVGEGAISVFNLSFNLQNVPLVLIGLSYSVAAFPTLSRLHTEGKTVEFLKHIYGAARQIIFWSLPMMVLFIVLRAQIVRVILGTGMFDWSDTRLTAASLAVFSMSMIAQGLVLLLVRAYYAAGKTWRPLGINLTSTAVIIIGAYGFLKLFEQNTVFQYFVESLLRVNTIEGTSILMLPLAFSLGSVVNFVWLWRAFRRDFLPERIGRLGKTFFQSLGASFIMGGVAYEGLQVFALVFDLDTFWGVFLQGFLSGIIGIAAGIIVLKLMKNKQLEEIVRVFKGKFWKTPVIAEGQSDL